MPKINVVDIFAGPGGLGEGFGRWSPTDDPADRPFRIVLSAEKDSAAVRTLRLRTFYRLCEANGGVPASYHAYLRGERAEPYDALTQPLWAEADAESSTLKLGTPEGDARLDQRLAETVLGERDWVLIGGPPCQAYSLAGRSRNKGNRSYSPEKDERHFLYTHYLRILAQHQPAVFLMENVKGILSSQVGGNLIFPQILRDLSRPDLALDTPDGARYELRPFVLPSPENDSDDPRNFVVHAEQYGIPQARHRVIILGIRQDKAARWHGSSLIPTTTEKPVKLNSFVDSTPAVRSGITHGTDDTAAWLAAIQAELRNRAAAGLPSRIAKQMREPLRQINHLHFPHGRGGRFVPYRNTRKGKSKAEQQLHAWLAAPSLRGVVNHEARSHMVSDLIRYLFASCYALNTGHTPSATEFPTALAPAHHNWNSGAFADRFRVQAYDGPSTTVVSHIAKDGHYYIHPDSRQCRSLTVREAARLQTFPEDFFFEGNRTEQYVQVGNAVPPFLAHQMAAEVARLLASR